MSEHNGDTGLTLFGAPQCHLCELAEAVVSHCGAQRAGLAYHKVDISGDAELMRRYGLRIPVLRFSDGRELGWPFDAEGLLKALDAGPG